MSVNSTDGSCWVVLGDSEKVIRIAEDGTRLVLAGGFSDPTSVSVDPTDGSCWVADKGNDQVVRLAADGTELQRVNGFSAPQCVAASPANSSCWVADHDNNDLVLVAATGIELWRGQIVGWPEVVAADATDGSCWVLSYFVDGEMVHVAQDGSELWRGPVLGSGDVSVDPRDGSCWSASGFSEVVHWAEDGTELWRGGSFDVPTSVSVDSADGSCWVADYRNGEVVHLVIVCSRFSDVMCDNWALDYIEACVDAGIVAGYPDGTYQSGNSVTRDQMAVYISRALAGGDSNLPAGPTQASFEDVPTTHWAFRYIEFAVSQGVVQGYDPTHYVPDLAVDRGQMAAFIARAIATPTGEAGVPDLGCTSPVFPDVPCDFWARKYIQFIRDAGVTSGYPDGKYHPEYACTRDQMAVYVARAFELPL
jgi:hypothetical protein